jgi:chaperonin cofactor prefoldin
MKKTIIIHDDFVEVLQDGYNIIENTVYDAEVIEQAKKVLELIGEDTGAHYLKDPLLHLMKRELSTEELKEVKEDLEQVIHARENLPF